MAYDPSNPAINKIEIYKQDTASLSSITAEIKADGALELSGYDAGEMAHQVYSHDDVESYVTVAPKDKDRLLLALLDAKFADDPQASSHFREFLDLKGIAYGFDTWP